MRCLLLVVQHVNTLSMCVAAKIPDVMYYFLNMWSL